MGAEDFGIDLQASPRKRLPEAWNPLPNPVTPNGNGPTFPVPELQSGTRKRIVMNRRREAWLCIGLGSSLALNLWLVFTVWWMLWH